MILFQCRSPPPQSCRYPLLTVPTLLCPVSSRTYPNPLLQSRILVPRAPGLVALVGSRVQRRVRPWESRVQKETGGSQRGRDGPRRSEAGAGEAADRGRACGVAPLRRLQRPWRRRRRHRPRAAACFLAFSLRSAMLEFLLVVLAAAAAATTEAAEAESAASVASGSPKGGAGNIM